MKENDKKERSWKIRSFPLIIVRALLVLTLAGALLNRRFLVLFVAGFAFLATFIPSLLRKKLGIKIPADFAVLVVLFIYGSFFLHEVRGLYASVWWWETLLNFGAAMALGIVGLIILYTLYKEEVIDANPWLITLFAFCFAFSVGTAWEFFEFGADKLFGFNLQHESLEDTMFDLLTNAVGALIVSIAGYFYIRYGEQNVVARIIKSFAEKNPFLFNRGKKETAEDKVRELISNGEGKKLEFKSTLRTNLHTRETDRKIEFAVLRTIVAHMNADGGTLLVGVGDKGTIVGIEEDGFENDDKFSLHFANLVKQFIGREFFSLIDYEVVCIDGKHILRIDCKPSDREVFLKAEGGVEEFYVRHGPSTVKLSGREMVDYIERRFRRRETR